MSSRRIQRLNEQLKREITSMIRGRLRDPRIQGASISEVEVTEDLWFARVHVNLTGDDLERGQALAGLEAATPFIRGELGRSLHIRRIPELRFIEDRTSEAAQRIEQLLRESITDDGDGGSVDPGEA